MNRQPETTPPEITGIYVHDHGEAEGDNRYELRFVFEGEVCFPTPEIAAAAVGEYEAILQAEIAPDHKCVHTIDLNERRAKA